MNNKIPQTISGDILLLSFGQSCDQLFGFCHALLPFHHQLLHLSFHFWRDKFVISDDCDRQDHREAQHVKCDDFSGLELPIFHFRRRQWSLATQPTKHYRFWKEKECPISVTSVSLSSLRTLSLCRFKLFSLSLSRRFSGSIVADWVTVDRRTMYLLAKLVVRDDYKGQ